MPFKIEIMVDEPILLKTEKRPLLHDFDEKLIANILGYSLEEIVTEKLRALLQSRKKLVERGWGASRVCRDFYDLLYILSREKLVDVPALFLKKCKIRKVMFYTPDELISRDLIDTARREWNQ
jgi:predicted nucleotidyltransferase component of viral defense system